MNRLFILKELAKASILIISTFNIRNFFNTYKWYNKEYPGRISMNKEHLDDNTFYVEMLGGFSISFNERKISSYSNQAKKPWRLLEYLVANRSKSLSNMDLINTIWGEEGGSNPAGALKTLLFRSRKLLEPFDVPPQKLIVQQQGSYTWTKDYKTEVDVDLFVDLSATALAPDADIDTCIRTGTEAVRLYKGDFLPQSAWEPWVFPVHTYYHNLYIKLVHRLLACYSVNKSYQQIIDLCHRAIAIEAFDEEFHYHLILALYNSGNSRAATEEYARMTDMFYDELGITPSDKLKDLYKVIHENSMQSTTNLNAIQASFQQENMRKGAFFCEYAVFKDIYLLESRAIARTGDSIYLCLFTITELDGEKLKASLLSKVMDEFQGSIIQSLRNGDVFSRFSINQYILLLPASSFEDGKKVLKRIVVNYNKEHARKNVKITYNLQAIAPLTLY